MVFMYKRVYGGGSITATPKSVETTINSKNNPTGTQPLAPHPFFQSPEVSSIAPIMNHGITISRAPLNSRATIKTGGTINPDLFNIDFNRSKTNKKKVYLNLG